MNNKLQFKVKHSVSDLICFIGKLNFPYNFQSETRLKNFKKLLRIFLGFYTRRNLMIMKQYFTQYDIKILRYLNIFATNPIKNTMYFLY